LWERDEMRREGACEVEGKRDATWEASRQPSVFMLNTQDAPLWGCYDYLFYYSWNGGRAEAVCAGENE
jgi:hypothetical protein